MRLKYLFCGSIFYISHLYASPVTITFESYPTSIVGQQKETESQILLQYSGVIGTGVKNQTVSAAGGAVEFWPIALQSYAFFTQTLANGIYYELRAYTSYNYISQNPMFPTVPISNMSNTEGYGFLARLGYDFNINQYIDLIPYVRLSNFYDMLLVYKDSNVNSINSVAYAVLPGIKIAYKVTPVFNPYIDISAGFQQVNLTGNFAGSPTPNSSTGVVDQTVINYEIGFSSKLTDSLSMIPFTRYITTTNSPNSSAAAPYEQNGFNISPLTATQPVYGFKLSYSW